MCNTFYSVSILNSLIYDNAAQLPKSVTFTSFCIVTYHIVPSEKRDISAEHLPLAVLDSWIQPKPHFFSHTAANRLSWHHENGINACRLSGKLTPNFSNSAAVFVSKYTRGVRSKIILLHNAVAQRATDEGLYCWRSSLFVYFEKAPYLSGPVTGHE